METRAEGGLICGEGNQTRDCCQEACDCTCDGPVAHGLNISSGPDPDQNAEFQAGYIFRSESPEVVEACLEMFASPLAPESCVAGDCNIPPQP